MGREDAGSIISPLKKRSTGPLGENAGRILSFEKNKNKDKKHVIVTPPFILYFLLLKFLKGKMLLD